MAPVGNPSTPILTDLDYSTVTGQTRLDVGDVVTDGSNKYQLIPADTGIAGWQSATLYMH